MDARDILHLAWVIPVLPAIGAVVLLLFGKRIGEPWAGWLATAMIGLAFVASAIAFFALDSLPSEERVDFLANISQGYTWMHVGGFVVDMRFIVDPLSSTMTLFVTGVATLIHIYAIGYMHGDPRFSRFFAYMNLFAASMLVLVLGSSFLVTFLGWEGVGLCSYLLISFWFERNSAAVAGKKAFVTNRVGDFGFMLAMFLIFANLGSLSYGVMGGASGLPPVDRDGDRPAVVPRRRRQERAVPAAHLAPRRDGGPDPGLGAHPRGDDGDRRCVPRGACPSVLRSVEPRRHGRRLGRRAHRVLRRDGRHRPEGHQARPRVVDDQPTRLHVPRGGHRRLHGRDLPDGRARVLQGASLPRRRVRHPRDARRAGHAVHGRAPQVLTDHRGHVHRGVARDLGNLPVRRLLGEGRDPRPGVVPRQLRAVGRRARRRGLHRVLHDPSGLARVLRRRTLADERTRAARRRGPRTPRVAVDHAHPVARPRDVHDPRRPHRPAVREPRLRPPRPVARARVRRRAAGARVVVPPGFRAVDGRVDHRHRRHRGRLGGVPQRPADVRRGRRSRRPRRRTPRRVRQGARQRLLPRRRPGAFRERTDHRVPPRALSEGVDHTVIDGAVNGVGALTRWGGQGVRRLQTGLVRNYALAIVAGTVLLIVYVTTRATF